MAYCRKKHQLIQNKYQDIHIQFFKQCIMLVVIIYCRWFAFYIKTGCYKCTRQQMKRSITYGASSDVRNWNLMETYVKGKEKARLRAEPTLILQCALYGHTAGLAFQRLPSASVFRDNERSFSVQSMLSISFYVLVKLSEINEL